MTIDRLLIVGTGAPGGIGRVEQLVAEAVHDPDHSPARESIAIWRRRHPDYLLMGAIESLAVASPATAGDGPLYVRELVRAIRHVRPTYILYTHINLARPAPWLRTLGHPARYGVWTYGVEVWPRLSWLHRHALSNAAVVMSISHDSVRRTIETQGAPASRTRLIPLSLPADMFAAASASGQAREPGRILTVSRLAKTEGGKNIDRLIAAMATVRERVPEAKLVVVGDGDDRERMESFARDLGLTKAVDFTGRISDDELRAQYGRADVFALPSEKEGFGLVFVEAMLAGTPVVGLAKGGPLDIIRDGIDGRLLSDVAELEDALASMLADRAVLRQMGGQAQARAKTSFSPANFRSEFAAALSADDGAPHRPLP